MSTPRLSSITGNGSTPEAYARCQVDRRKHLSSRKRDVCCRSRFRVDDRVREPLIVLAHHPFVEELETSPILPPLAGTAGAQQLLRHPRVGIGQKQDDRASGKSLCDGLEVLLILEVSVTCAKRYHGTSMVSHTPHYGVAARRLPPPMPFAEPVRRNSINERVNRLADLVVVLISNFIQIDERSSRRLGKQGPDRGLSDRRRADENNSGWIHPQHYALRRARPGPRLRQ